MGLLVNGEWQDKWYDTEGKDGRFEREEQSFRNWITRDGEAGPSGSGGFPAAKERYHLYVSYACPWAHRALLVRRIKGLQDMIGVSVVHWFMGDRGWTFEKEDAGIVGDRLYGSETLADIYRKADPQFTGRVTVPVLWDTERETIVSNESSEIIRMFNTAFNDLGATDGDITPAAHREEIEALNDQIYRTVNNGVYKAGFATQQDAYEEAVVPLFETLDDIERRLSRQRFLCGTAPTEADWRLLPTLLRFDLVYHGHFKCNRRKLVEYTNLWAYMLDLYQWPGVAETCNFDHARRHYYASHDMVNPTRIVPVGPEDYEEQLRHPHGRERLAVG